MQMKPLISNDHDHIIDVQSIAKELLHRAYVQVGTHVFLARTHTQPPHRHLQNNRLNFVPSTQIKQKRLHPFLPEGKKGRAKGNVSFELNAH